MNYKKELQSNNTDLQSVLETVRNLPEAGGSATIDVCSIYIDHSGHSDRPTTFCFTTFSDGEISFVTQYTEKDHEYTIENVVCGSLICFGNDEYGGNGITVRGGVVKHMTACEHLWSVIAPEEAGAEGVIELWPDN